MFLIVFVVILVDLFRGKNIANVPVKAKKKLICFNYTWNFRAYVKQASE